MRRVRLAAALLCGAALTLTARPTAAQQAEPDDGSWQSSGTVESEVTTTPTPGSGSGGGTGGSGPEYQGGSGGGADAGPTQGYACSPNAPVGSAQACDQGDPAAAPAPEVVAQLALDRVTFSIPEPQTSPDGHQITGVPTWFWLASDEWLSFTARAELPGVWAEVTAAPVSASWDPGDGSPAVVCDGPGRPATSGGVPECAHTYTVVGDYTLTLRVTYAVTWRASTGASGSFDAIVLTDTAPVEVQQRQAVTD